MKDISEMRGYLLLWLTQLVSGLGSAMTAYALVIWSYTQSGSALRTALLMVCSYAPMCAVVFLPEHLVTAGTKRKQCWCAMHWLLSVHWQYWRF